MLGIDTNVLVRFLVRDDEAQFDRAQKLIRRNAAAGDPVFIGLLVLMETEWALRSRYQYSKDEILDTFAELLASLDVSFEDEGSIEEALYLWRNSPVRFADCLIGARHRSCGCRATASFDEKAARLSGFVSA